MPTPWLKIEASRWEPMVVAPAERVMAWPGGAPTGEKDVYLTYFQPVMNALKKAHPELAWQGSKDTPFVRVKSEAEAQAVIAKLLAFLKTKDAATKAKKQKELTVFRDAKGDHRIATVTDVSGADELLAAVKGKDVTTWKLGKEPILLWAPTVNHEIRARVEDSGFVIVDSDDEVEPTGKGKPQGTWKFDRGLAVVHWGGIAVRECKGHEANKLSTLEAAVAKKPAVALKPNDKDAGGGAAVLKIAPGTYRAETGGDKKARWLRFTKA